MVVIFVCWANSHAVLAGPTTEYLKEVPLRQLTDGPEDKILIDDLLQRHLVRFEEVIRHSPRVEVVAYGDAADKARSLPVCKQLMNDLHDGVVRQPVPILRMSNGEDSYYRRVSSIATAYSRFHEEKLAAIQDSPKTEAIARQDFRRALNAWFLDREWTYRGMNFLVANSMASGSKPRRYAHDLWLYTNGHSSDGLQRYQQLEFFVYQELDSKKSWIDSISTFDLTPDRGFGDTGDRLGFGGSRFSNEAWGAKPLNYQYEAFGVVAAGEKILTWNLFRNPEKIDIPKDWRHEPWSFKAQIYSDLGANENDGSLTCSFFIK